MLVARRLTVVIRQLLMICQQMEEKQIPFEQNLRLSNYLERFRAHFKSRMNARRSGVLALTSDEKLDELAINLLGQLLFCTGTLECSDSGLVFLTVKWNEYST